MSEAITSLIEKLEAGPVYLTHKEAYDLAIWFGSDTALGLAQAIRKAFAGGSIDAALALAKRVLPGWNWTLLSERERFAISDDPRPFAGLKRRGPEVANEGYAGASASTPALALCAAILRAKGSDQ